MLQKYFTKTENVILGGNLNFTLGTHKIWAIRARTDPLAFFYEQNIREDHLFDIAPTKIKSSWTNKRTGENIIGKRLDRFLTVENFIEQNARITQWVYPRGDYDYNTIFLKLFGE